MTETDNVIVKSEECIFMCVYGWISAQIILCTLSMNPATPQKLDIVAIPITTSEVYCITTNKYIVKSQVLDSFIITLIGKLHHKGLIQKRLSYFLSLGRRDKALHKVSNQRSYKIISIRSCYGNFPLMHTFV